MLNDLENSSVIKSQIVKIDKFLKQMHSILNDATKRGGHVEQSLGFLTEAIEMIEKNIEAEQAPKKALEVQAQDTVPIVADKKDLKKPSTPPEATNTPTKSTAP